MTENVAAPDRSHVAATASRGRVIVAVESAEHDAGPIAWAERYARFHDLPMVVAHTYTVPPPVPRLTGEPGVWTDQQALEASAGHVAGRVVERLRSHGVDVTSSTIQDNAGAGIVSIAHPSDVIVAGTEQGGGIRHFLRGGTVHALLRHAPCPVVVVPCRWHDDLSEGRRRIVVGYDGSERAQAALRWAAEEASLRGSPLDVIRAVMGGPVDVTLPDDAAVDAIEEQTHQSIDVRPVVSTVEGVARSLTTAARGAELLVLGNHRASWFAALGAYSVPESAVLEPFCPVAVIPEEDDIPAR